MDTYQHRILLHILAFAIRRYILSLRNLQGRSGQTRERNLKN